MSEDDFYKIRVHVIIFTVAAVTLALDVFVWRP